MSLKSVIEMQMILYWGAQLNFQFSLLQLHTKSLCVLALQNSQFEASTSSRPQTVNFEALGHKAIFYLKFDHKEVDTYVKGYLFAYQSHCLPAVIIILFRRWIPRLDIIWCGFNQSKVSTMLS